MAVKDTTGPASGNGSVPLILHLAEDHGLVTRRQLLRAGLSRDAVHRQVRAGLLRPRYAGVYQVGPVMAPYTRERAAMLASRDGVISYVSALALRQIVPVQTRGEPVDVTTSSHCGRRAGIRAHRDHLADDEITVLHAIRVTSTARTLLDVSRVMTGRELERALAGAERADPKTVAQVSALLERYPGRKGTATLRVILAGTRAFTRSELEERALRLVRESGLPQPLLNVVAHGFELDCYWPDAGVAVELDGYEYHRTRDDFDRDRRRDTALAARGIQVIRVSWDQITKRPVRTIAEIAQALARTSRRS